MKVTEQAIREAMRLQPGVAVTLGVLCEPTATRIAIVGNALYTIMQDGAKVTLNLQFGAPSGPIGHPSRVEFYLVDVEKVQKMQDGVNAFVAQLRREGDSDGADRIAALLTLDPADMERVYDALTAGMSKAEFLHAVTTQSVEEAERERRALLKQTNPFIDDATGCRIRLTPGNNGRTSHLYTVGVSKDGATGQIDVEANNRDQAARVAERNGYEVRDVNMVG